MLKFSSLFIYSSILSYTHYEYLFLIVCIAFFFGIKEWYIFREKEMEGERGRETLIGCLLYVPQPGTESTTYTCALIRNRADSLLLCRTTPHQPSRVARAKEWFFLRQKYFSTSGLPISCFCCESNRMKCMFFGHSFLKGERRWCQMSFVVISLSLKNMHSLGLGDLQIILPYSVIWS